MTSNIIPVELLTRETLYQAAQCLVGQNKLNQVLPDSQVLYDFCVFNGVQFQRDSTVVLQRIDTTIGTPLHAWLLWEALGELKKFDITSQEDANLRRGLTWWLYSDPEYRQTPVIENPIGGYPQHTWYAWLTYMGVDALWVCRGVGSRSDPEAHEKRARLLVSLEKHLPTRVQNL